MTDSFEKIPGKNTTVSLDTLKPGDKCRVVKVTGKGAIFKRILDIGIHPGAEIVVERVAPLGDPVEFKLKGCHVSLRRQEAENILVEVIAD
jgi:Fe2+ transport system protein FeoA